MIKYRSELQKSRFQLIQGASRKDPMGACLGGQRNSGMLGDFPVQLLLEVQKSSLPLSRKRSRHKKKSIGKAPSYQECSNEKRSTGAVQKGTDFERGI